PLPWPSLPSQDANAHVEEPGIGLSPHMTGDASPVCPTCGAGLFVRSHGDMTCVQHGHFFSAQLLDASFGAGAAQRARQLVARAPLTPRKCPDDRYEMSQLGHADACARCGAVWMPLAAVESRMQQAPRPDVSPSEQRSLAAFDCVRA